MITPLVKLIHDTARKVWICGDEVGGVVLATDEFIEDAIDGVLSKRLAVVRVPKSLPSMTAATVDGRQEHIDFAKGIVAGRYLVRLGFGEESLTWIYRDGFEYLEESRSLKEIADGLDWQN